MRDATHQFIFCLRGLTARTIAYRMTIENERGLRMESRLREKLKLAGGVAGRVGVKIEAKADAIIARETEFDGKITESFAPHEAMLEDAGAALDGLADDLRLLTNGPLPSSPAPAPESPGGTTATQQPGS